MKEIYSPGVLSVLPLFYVGWSDSVLGPSERDMIINRLEEMPHLSESDRKMLAKWTDQKNPPSERIFKSWLNAIKVNERNLNETEKITLVDLGISIAKRATPENKLDDLTSPKVRESLYALERTLGLDDYLDGTLLFNKLNVKLDETNNQAEQQTENIADFLDSDFKVLKNKVRQLLRDPMFSNKDERIKEAYREKILKQCKELGKMGYGSYAYPKAYGGHDNPLENTVIFEMVAHGDISLLIKFGVQFGLFGGALFMLGTKKHHDKYLAKTGTLEIAGCFAMTETGHGSNVKGLETTATYDPSTDSLVINSPSEHAGKEYIGNAMDSTMAAVFAQLIVEGKNHGVHAVLVPLRDDQHRLLPGIRVEDCGYKMGLNGVDNGRIWFDQVSVSRENLLNKYGDIDAQGNYSSPIKSAGRRFFTMLGALVAGRVSIALASNSAAKNALTIAITYALKRRQFRQSDEDVKETLIMDYPSHQLRLFPKLAKTYALHFGLEKLRKMYAYKISTGDMRLVESLAAGLKSVSSWHVTETIQECREACGGKGYLSENGFTDLKADTDIFTTFEGDNNVLLQLVSKGLLTEFKEQFQDGGYLSIIRHLSGRLSKSITEANPITIRNTNAEHLLSEEFHLQALEYRENTLLFSLSGRMRNFIKRRLNPSETYLLVQNHMITLAIASIENFCAKQFYAQINDISDEDLKVNLRRMARLYALDTIYNHRGWFLEHDYISGAKSKAIRKQIDHLCKKVRPNAQMYVDAFRIPQELLRSEIIK